MAAREPPPVLFPHIPPEPEDIVWLSGSRRVDMLGDISIMSPRAFRSEDGAKRDASDLRNPANQLIIKCRVS